MNVSNLQQFGNCTSLRFVKLPVTLLGIGDQSFAGCTALEYVISYAITPPTLNGSNVFAYTNTIFKIYVPDDSVSAYKSTNGWSTYASRIYPLSQWSTDFPNG